MPDNKTTRRDFLAYSVALASGVAACGQTDNNTGTTMTKPLTDLTAVQAVAAMRRGELSATEYATALLTRCEEAANLNAFISFEPDKVLKAARAADELHASGAELGPLHGLPIPVKDSVNTKDYPTTGGTPALADFRPAEDAELVKRLMAAGAIVLGKTNIHELSFGWTSNNQAFGAVRNPYGTDRIPGGSSGGTAAAIASHMAPLGIAEDTQGSVRVPAALCGVYGYRPTQNRYPNTGVVPITPLFDQVGPHARNVADIALFDHVITGEPIVDTSASLDGLRLGVAREFYFTSLDTEVEKISEDALRKLEDAGVTLVDADVLDLAKLISLTTAHVQGYHVKPMLDRYLQEFGAGITIEELLEKASPDIQAAFRLYTPGGEMGPTEADFVAARDIHLPALRETMQTYFEANDLDAMIFPATQIVAPPIGQDFEVQLNGKTVPFEPVISRNISPGSTSGIPGLVVPVALNSNGLPVSLEIDGPEGSDRKLLGIGLAIEKILGHLPPPA
jgi:mandelamide amidase